MTALQHLGEIELRPGARAGENAPHAGVSVSPQRRGFFWVSASRARMQSHFARTPQSHRATGLWEMNGTSIAAVVGVPNAGAKWQLVNGHPFARGCGRTNSN